MKCKYCKKEISSFNLHKISNNVCIILCDSCIKTTKDQTELFQNETI